MKHELQFNNGPSVAKLDAVIFDMDGVVTRTAGLHAAAWKHLFDEFLEAKVKSEAIIQPFDIEEDYRRHVDGRPRYDGVASFLASRGVYLPYGDPSNPPQTLTICGLGNKKDNYFRQLLSQKRVEVFESTIGLIRCLRAAGIKTGVFSASRNAQPILSAANVLMLFDAKVDGVDADELGIPGKPHPAMLLELTRRLGTAPERTAIVEDSIAGVYAGKRGRFALVIGVNRSATPGQLLNNGADIEVADLGEVDLVV